MKTAALFCSHLKHNETDIFSSDRNVEHKVSLCKYCRILHRNKKNGGAVQWTIKGIITFQAHPDAEALLEATERTSFPLRLVYFTLLVLGARVSLVVLHGSLEEALQKEKRKKRVCC